MLKNSISLKQCVNEWKDPISLADLKNIKNDFKSDNSYRLIDVLKDVANLEDSFKSWIGILHGTFIGMSDNWFKKSEVSFPFYNNSVVS